MGFLFGASAFTGFLGWQWRRVRTIIPEEVAALKATLPKPAGGALARRVSPRRFCAHASRPHAADSPAVALSAEQLATQSRIDALGEERKALMAEGVRDKHFNWGSLLLALGVAIAIEGPVNTYLRTGKLFPGPHLYAGAGIVVLWAAAAACVPQMQKGNDTARSAHIALNAVNMALFAWQIPTGLEIVGKVFQFTSWP